MNRPVGVAIRKWRAYFSAYAALPGDTYSEACKIGDLLGQECRVVDTLELAQQP
jgi:hypothetical protein